MPSLEYPNTTKWVVCHSGTGPYHFTTVTSEQCFKTGQEFMEVFESYAEAYTAFPDLTATFEPLE